MTDRLVVLAVGPSRGAVEASPPAESAPLLVPPTNVPEWHTWVERIHASPGRMQWPCPLAGCEAVLPSAAYAAEHLVDWHGWTELEISAWWGR